MSTNDSDDPEPTPGHGIGTGVAGALVSITLFAIGKEPDANRDYVSWFLRQKSVSATQLQQLAQRIRDENQETISHGGETFVRTAAVKQQLDAWQKTLEERLRKWAKESAVVAKQIANANSIDSLEKAYLAGKQFDDLYVGDPKEFSVEKAIDSPELTQYQASLLGDRALDIIKNVESVDKLEKIKSGISPDSKLRKPWETVVYRTAVDEKLAALQAEKKTVSNVNTDTEKDVGKEETEKEVAAAMSWWQIALIATAGFILLLLIVLLSRWLIRRAKKQSDRSLSVYDDDAVPLEEPIDT